MNINTDATLNNIFELIVNYLGFGIKAKEIIWKKLRHPWFRTYDTVKYFFLTLSAFGPRWGHS
jgi:hypothetical protein